MKKISLLVALSFALFTSIMAQTLVSTDTQAKNAVLEEFTGIHCGYCPEGHAIAQQLIDENPGRVVAIAIHQGGYANPGSGEPDYRTEFGDAIAGQTGLSGYPAGTVNRHLFNGASVTALGRSGWPPAAQEIMSEDSPVNVGVATSYNNATRELTINVELYYTSDSPESANFLNIALLQSHIFGPQSGGGQGNNYEHMHMLRHLITGQWGEEITNTTAGSFFQQTFTYTVPEDYNDVACIVEDCDIAVFVNETHQEIYSGVVVPAIDGTTLLTGLLTAPESNILVGAPSSTSTFNMDFSSVLTGSEEFTFSLSSSNAPAAWNSSFTIDGNTYTDVATITLEEGVTNNFTIDIEPNNESSFAKYTLTIQSVSHPNAPAINQDIYVISNVGTLLLHNQGAWGNGIPSDFEDDYFAGFEQAECTDYASCGYNAFLTAANADLLGAFTNIFFNVAWTFPSLTDDNVVFLANYIDNGGNLFIAGQDMGWDTWESAGNGTSNTQAFYTNYLKADYKADGSTSNNSFTPNTDDEIFGGIGTSTITDIYAGNMYPDEIDAIGNGISISTYNDNANKGSGIRSMMGTAKVVYMGFDPSMLSNDDVRNDLIATTYDWFMNGVGFNEINTSEVSIYPNPVSSQLNINMDIENNSNVKVEMYDILGKIVYSQEFNNLQSGNQTIPVQTNQLKNGVYIVSVNNGQKVYKQEIIINR
jgi:hypothetical protein